MVDLSSLSSFKSGFIGLTSYIWILWIFVPLAILIFGVWIYKIWKKKKTQWTHTLSVRRVLTNGLLSKENKIRMKRFPLIKNASIFELENPFLGSYLMMELDSYTGTNEFSVIIDKNNRIYINTGEKFDPDSSSIIVSAKHAGIDLAFEDLKGDWQNIHKVEKRVEWSQIAKFAMIGLLIIASMVVIIKGVGQWGENHKIDAERSLAEAEVMRNLADAMDTAKSTMNTQLLILDLLKKNYGTNNIQEIIREKNNASF